MKIQSMFQKDIDRPINGVVIVSKGIHELSEEDCIAYFPVMREGIMLILRQWRAKQDEAETARKLATSLSKITANISKEGNN